MKSNNAQQLQVNEIINIVNSLDNLKSSFINVIGNNTTPINDNDLTLKFTQKELYSMPQYFRKEFKTEGITAKVRRRQTGKNTYVYDIRYRRNGYNILACSKNLEEAKKKFIEKLQTATPTTTSTKNYTPTFYGNVPSSFNSFAMYYFRNFRIKKIAKNTYENDMYRFKNHLKPYFEEIPIKKITSLDCQNLLDKLTAEGKGKTADEVYTLMNIIFKAAISHDIISKNPLEIVFHKKHEKKHGKSLTKDEEKLLLSSTEGTSYQLMFAIALFTGMRPNEYETAKVEGDFIVAKNSKRKGGKIEYKKIPITPMLKPYIKNIETITFIKITKLREIFNSILPNHILYDLRTTFYSRCIECGVSEIAQKLFVGHSLGELGNAYTDVSDEFLIKEGNKLNY